MPSLNRTHPGRVTQVGLLSIRCSVCAQPFRGRLFCPADGQLSGHRRTIAGRYALDHLIGSGPSCFVFTAVDQMQGRMVVLKVLRPALAADPALAAGFLRRARMACLLQHDNIAGALDAGQDVDLGGPFLVRDHVEARTLADALHDEGPLPMARSLRILSQVARALAAARTAGVIHGDLAPHNVLLVHSSGGHDIVKVVDFGLARTRADIHAFGALAFLLLTGRPPRDGETRADGAGLPLALEEIISRCMSPGVLDLPPSIEEVEAALALAADADRTAGAPDLVGSTVSHYRITALLGQGGVGRVYLGEHCVIGSKVAIKVLHPWMSTDRAMVERFLHEARASIQLGCPYIPVYYDFGFLTGGRPYAVMEYLSGETLATRIARRGRLELHETCEIVRQVAIACAQAHAAGIVHRDLKPENLFLVPLSDGRTAVKVLDFGIARLARATARTIRTTPHYCAPEQALGQEGGPAADVYALGATVVEMLSGKLLFSGDPDEVLRAKVGKEPPPLEALCPELPAHVRMILAAMIARRPEDRGVTMADVVRAVDDCLGHRPVEIGPSAPLRRQRRWWRRLALNRGSASCT